MGGGRPKVICEIDTKVNHCLDKALQEGEMVSRKEEFVRTRRGSGYGSANLETMDVRCLGRWWPKKEGGG